MDSQKECANYKQSFKNALRKKQEKNQGKKLNNFLDHYIKFLWLVLRFSILSDFFLLIQKIAHK